MQMYQGIDSFKGQPWKDVRVLFIRNVTVDRIYVRKDAGIKTFTDLCGKRFSPGIPGASSTLYIMKFNDVLKANINFMPGALGDSIGAFQSNKIVGLQKTSPLKAIDASLIEVNMTTPITVIGFTKSDTEKIRKVYPYIPFIETPKGDNRPVARRRPDVRNGPDRRGHGLQEPSRGGCLQHRESLLRRHRRSGGVLPGGQGLGSRGRPLQIRTRRAPKCPPMPAWCAMPRKRGSTCPRDSSPRIQGKNGQT